MSKFAIDFSNEKSRTKQCFRDECDINNIMSKYVKTGQLPSLIKENPQYGDFSEPLDYQKALDLVSFADEQFSALPSGLRKKFSNDPLEFLNFVHNPDNIQEMYDLGLAVKPVVIEEKVIEEK